MGRFELGVELEYIKRYSFSGVGAAPSTDDEVAFTSLRYYFQSRRTRVQEFALPSAPDAGL
jgi:hypothetical protein